MSQLAKQIIRQSTTGSLGTIDQDGHPFVSLVTTAATGPTSMVMLLSALARHTKNLFRHPHGSLMLVQAGGESGDPLAGARITVKGPVAPLAESPVTREAFLAKHPSAEMYVDFGDFAFYELKITEAYLVAGFGKIEAIDAKDL